MPRKIEPKAEQLITGDYAASKITHLVISHVPGEGEARCVTGHLVRCTSLDSAQKRLVREQGKRSPDSKYEVGIYDVAAKVILD